MKTYLSNSTGVSQPCVESVAQIQDALYVLNGKWKMPLIFTLNTGPQRFNEIQRLLGDITPKMLSKELKELELNEFVIRKVPASEPFSVTYELTPYGLSLRKVIEELKDLGSKHRERIAANRKGDKQ